MSRSEARSRGQSRVRWVPWLVVAILALIAALGTGVFSGATEPLLVADVGAWARWSQLAMPVVRNLAAAITVGLLVLGAFAIPEGVMTGRRKAITTSASVTATIWALSAFVSLLVGFSEISATIPTVSAYWSSLFESLGSTETVRWWALEVILAATVADVCTMIRTRVALAWTSVLSLAALIPLVHTGHSAGAESSATSVTGLGLHAMGVSVWVGGLLAIVGLQRRLGTALTATVSRFSAMAMWAFAAVGCSGVLLAVRTIGSPSDLTEPYWLLLWGKIILLIVLGVFGWWHRGRVLAGGLERSGVFAHWAGMELLVMAAVMGISVTVSRTPPTGDAGAVVASSMSLLVNFADPSPVTVGTWFTTWRTDWLSVLIGVVCIGVYVVGVGRLAARRRRWPLFRTVAWVCGWAIFIFVTCGAPVVYGKVIYSVYTVHCLALLMVIPVLLVIAAPMHLATCTLRPRSDDTLGPLEVFQALTTSRFMLRVLHPAVAPVLWFAVLLVLCVTGVSTLPTTTHTGYVLTILLPLAAGCVFVAALGAPVGIGRTYLRWRVLAAMKMFAGGALLGAVLMRSTSILQTGFFPGDTLLGGSDALLDQRIGGLLILVLSSVFAAVMAVLTLRAPVDGGDAAKASYVEPVPTHGHRARSNMRRVGGYP